MTPFDALLNMSQLTLRARGEWGRMTGGLANIDRAVNNCADLLRRDDMPDLITITHIEAAIIELKIRCGWHVESEYPAEDSDYSVDAEAAHERRQLGSYGR